MGLRIPAHLRDLATSIGAQSWVAGRNFGRDRYFAYVDKLKLDLAAFCAPDDIGPELLVPILARVVDAEDVFIGHVLKTTVEIKDPETWLRMCEAVAYSILQRYHRELENGKWVP